MRQRDRHGPRARVGVAVGDARRLDDCLRHLALGLPREEPVGAGTHRRPVPRVPLLAARLVPGRALVDHPPDRAGDRDSPARRPVLAHLPRQESREVLGIAPPLRRERKHREHRELRVVARSSGYGVGIVRRRREALPEVRGLDALDRRKPLERDAHRVADRGPEKEPPAAIPEAVRDLRPVRRHSSPSVFAMISRAYSSPSSSVANSPSIWAS